MNGRLERLSPTARVIAWRLTEGRCVSYDEYLDALWRNCPDGGPLWARTIINIKLVELRRDLIPIRTIIDL